MPALSYRIRVCGSLEKAITMNQDKLFTDGRTGITKTAYDWWCFGGCKRSRYGFLGQLAHYGVAVALEWQQEQTYTKRTEPLNTVMGNYFDTMPTFTKKQPQVLGIKHLLENWEIRQYQTEARS